MANLAKVIHDIDGQRAKPDILAQCQASQETANAPGYNGPAPRVLRSELIGALQAFVEAEEAWREQMQGLDFDDPLTDAYDNAKAVLAHVDGQRAIAPATVLSPATIGWDRAGKRTTLRSPIADPIEVGVYESGIGLRVQRHATLDLPQQDIWLSFVQWDELKRFLSNRT